MELTEDDVLHILKLIDESKFDYFQLEVGELKITVSKGDPIPLASSPRSAPVSQFSHVHARDREHRRARLAGDDIRAVGRAVVDDDDFDAIARIVVGGDRFETPR